MTANGRLKRKKGETFLYETSALADLNPLHQVHIDPLMRTSVAIVCCLARPDLHAITYKLSLSLVLAPLVLPPLVLPPLVLPPLVLLPLVLLHVDLLPLHLPPLAAC
jgi:hypothetical protein